MSVPALTVDTWIFDCPRSGGCAGCRGRRGRGPPRAGRRGDMDGRRIGRRTRRAPHRQSHGHGRRGADRHVVLHLGDHRAPTGGPAGARIRRQQAGRRGSGRGSRARRVRRADLVGARLRPVHGEDRAERPPGRGRRRLQADRLAGEAARHRTRRARRPAGGHGGRVVRRGDLAAGRRVRPPGGRDRPRDHVLEPGGRPVPERRVQEALGRRLHELRRRLREVHRRTVRDVQPRGGVRPARRSRASPSSMRGPRPRSARTSRCPRFSSRASPTRCSRSARRTPRPGRSERTARPWTSTGSRAGTTAGTWSRAASRRASRRGSTAI